MATTGSGSGVSGEEFLLRCPGCGKGYRIHPEKLPEGLVSFNCRNCGGLVPLTQPRTAKPHHEEEGSIVVVVSEPELAQLVLRVLARSGFQGKIAHSGHDALKLLEKAQPKAMLVNVILPDMMGYELIDRLKGTLGLSVPSILLSSIHHAMRYKRAPTSLYGADDHVERHHLPDMLVPKIQRLLGKASGEGPLLAGPEMTSPPKDQDVQDQRDLVALERKEQENVHEPLEKEIRRMCRIIAADIALYNEDIIRGTAFGGLLEALSRDLDEGEKLLRSRFPAFEGEPSALLREEMERVLASRGVRTPTGDGHES